MQIARCCLCKVSDNLEWVWGLRVQIATKLPGGAIKLVCEFIKLALSQLPGFDYSFNDLDNFKKKPVCNWTQDQTTWLGIQCGGPDIFS